MKNPWIKLLLVALLTALCVWEIAVKEIRLGKDLKGGVSLIYAVSTPGSQPGDQVLGQVIDVLKQRALNFRHAAKKGELLRAGLQALAALSETDLQAALERVTSLKPGRPKKAG